MANQSKALIDRSQLRRPTSFFSSRARLQSSAHLINTIVQGRPLRKHDILGEKVCAKDVQLIKHHFFQQFEDFREETDRSAIVFVRRFILLWIEVTLLIAQSICSTVSDQPLLFWLLLIVIFQTNMILKEEIATLQILLKLNTPGQSLFYLGEARVNHCCRHFLSITGF